MRTRSAIIAFAAGAMALGLLSGCYPEVEREPRTNLLCESSDACPSGQSCISGLCGVEETGPRELAFRLLPTPSSGYRPQFVDAAPIEPSRGVDIGMEASVEIVGTVRRGGDGSGVAGTLVFERTNTRTNDSVQVSVSPDGAYEALVGPGSYRVTMIPEGELIPPFAWTGLDFELDTAWDFAMPGESSARTVTVTTDLPAAPDFGERARELLAARIVAVSRETGVSSTSVDFLPGPNEEGSPRASLRVFADTGEYDLQITPASPESIVPAATFEKAFVCEDICTSTLAGTEGADIVSLDFQQDFTTLSDTTFALTFPSESTPTWDGVKVRVTRPLERGELVVRPEVSADGVFTVRSLAGSDYTIDVLTPPDSPFASRRFPGVELADSTSRVALEMSLKNRLSGAIADVDGNTLSEARIELTPTMSNTARFAREVVASTETDGSFDLWVEPGDYWVTVIPLEAGKPRFITRIDDEIDPGTVSWRLSEPTVVYGTVFGAPPAAEEADDAWKPVSDVAVQVLELFGNEYVVVGEGTTANKGDFRIAIRTRPTP